MKKNEIRSIIILGIVFVAFSVVAFALPFTKNAAFWISYVFGVIAIGVQGYGAYSAFSKGDKNKSKLYGFPIVRIATVYAIAQIVISFLFIALAKIVPVWVVLTVCILGLCAAAIGLITTETVRDEIEKQDVRLKKNVSLMRGLQSKTRSIVGQCSDKELSVKLKDLSDKFQYSDPVSNEVLNDIETELSALVDELQRAVLDEDFPAAEKLCKKTESVLSERNSLCKLNK